MNYKTVLLWIVGGLLAYISGRSGNLGTQIYTAILAGTFFVVGCCKLFSFESDDKQTMEVNVTCAIKPDQSPCKKKFKVGDTVKIIKTSSVNECHLGKTGVILEKTVNTYFDWRVKIESYAEPFHEYQLELVTRENKKVPKSPKKSKYARPGTITHPGMTPAQKSAIYNARWIAKKKLNNK
jgi:hypothetical protein